LLQFLKITVRNIRIVTGKRKNRHRVSVGDFIYPSAKPIIKRNAILLTLESMLLPPFQNVGRFDFSRFIYFAVYLDICYI